MRSDCPRCGSLRQRPMNTGWWRCIKCRLEWMPTIMMWLYAREFRVKYVDPVGEVT